MGWLWFFIFSILLLVFSVTFWQSANNSISSRDVPSSLIDATVFWAENGLTVAIVVIIVLGILNGLYILGSRPEPVRIEERFANRSDPDFALSQGHRNMEDTVRDELRKD